MERENRKVLISVKVSTLLLILLSIIAIVVVGNIISNKIEESKTIANANSQENSQSEEINENKEETNEVRTIKAEITSRSQGETREDVNLQGNVGMINIESIEHSLQEEIEESAEPIEEVPATTPIEEVTISRDMNLTVRTGLSREDFITLIAGVEEDTSGFFEENAGLIFDLCEKYQINEIFFCGLIAGESGWRIADNHRRTYNYISLMSHGGLIRYSSVEDGLEKAAMALHNNYLTEGGRFYHGPTLAGVKTRFCPASSTWINLIYGNMERILK
ncbi:MAG: hypothetical protein IJW20_00185 [Clostridia bacterium]|nr:hypothetical protein [Clostridia bacterium]